MVAADGFFDLSLELDLLLLLFLNKQKFLLKLALQLAEDRPTVLVLKLHYIS